MNEIKKLWHQHQQAAYPADCCVEIEGEDLVSLDSYTAGCVSTFIGRTGTLDKKRYECLLGCRDALAKVIPALSGEGKAYFERLLTLSELVLAQLQTGHA